jgi:hypothetical protein
MEDELSLLKGELQTVATDLNNNRKILAMKGLTATDIVKLSDYQCNLLKRQDKLEDQIKALQTPTATTFVPAPPGNSITLPQVLPLSSIASFLLLPSFFRIRSTNYRRPITIKL